MTVETILKNLLAGDRRSLAKAITLVEGGRSDQREFADLLLSHILPYSGKAIRVGISGVPGVGKSTFIEALGTYLTQNGHRVAVLTIDPSSRISGGSILADKVRMEKLASDPNAFIRSSPSGTTLGGVARRTRECMLLCEVAGYDVVLVETVGVGQSEIAVAEMVDFFLVLMLPNAGDELQGIKRGIMELVDALVINKADGEGLAAANRARNFYKNSFHYMRPKHKDWTPGVLTCSSLNGLGIEDVWKVAFQRYQHMLESGLLHEQRKKQELSWYDTAVIEGLFQRVFSDPAISKMNHQLREELKKGFKAPYSCADELLKFIGKGF